MRIAYFTDTFFPAINGISTSIANISSGLIDRGHNVLICAPRPGKGKKILLSDKRINIKTLFSIPSFIYPDLRISTATSPVLIRQVKKFTPDIIHVQTPLFVGGGGILIGKLFNRPVVSTFHGYFMEPEYLKLIGLENNTKLITNILWKYAVSFFNQTLCVVCPCEIVKKDLERHGIEKPIMVISNSINETQIKKVNAREVAALKRRYRLFDNVVLYVGRLSKEKNIPVLMRSFARMLPKNPRTSLFLIGNGPIRKELEALALALAIQHNVRFAGEIVNDTLLTEGYYQTATVFATASTSETQGVSLIEAMYFGLPLVGVAKRGVAEMVAHVGLLSSPRNVGEFAAHLSRILIDATFAKKLSQQSYETYLQKYKRSTIVDTYIQLYQKIRHNEPSLTR